MVEGLGVLDLASLVGGPPGVDFEWAGARYLVLRPTLSDLLGHLRRTAQIVTPKDAAQILLIGGIGPGARVAEAGAGSGALTTALAYAVGPIGRVVSCDRRHDFLENARQNLAASGLSERVEFRERDVASQGFGSGGFDAVVLDLPEPWEVLEAAAGSLVRGGRVVTYTPTYNQLERTVQAMRGRRFEEVRALELLERELHVGAGGTRPEFEMLGHTGFLAVGRRVTV